MDPININEVLNSQDGFTHDKDQEPGGWKHLRSTMSVFGPCCPVFLPISLTATDMGFQVLISLTVRCFEEYVSSC